MSSSSINMNICWISVVLFLEIAAVAKGKIKIIEGDKPGSCGKSNQGDEILIRDRQKKQKLLICTKDNGIFQWRTTDGSRTPGEFFSPAYDCSAILDADPKAKNGLYWIKMNSFVPKKVWCDMTTDGGGFMLVGRKNSSVTWTVPSSNKPVTPFGYPHWSSALGEAPIQDFRVQVATAEDFKTTKAHWFYRLRNKRQLKNLMVINKGGCDQDSPGIGDVAYVKDLQTEKIVTTKFRCSKFGVGHHPRTKFGWSMMNSCLQKPCRWGFAFHRKLPVQTDYSGAFSYSTERSISGVGKHATAFVGCDNAHCCGCYGPKGGTKDYCSKQCQSKNGGRIKAKVFSWFWVRSSLPKRVWKKCMEYKVTKNGATLWYKMVRGNSVPVKGRCGENEALLYDGVVVVPDNVTAKKVPSVDGIMVYQKDSKELYIKDNNTMKMIAQEKKVANMLNKDVKNLENRIGNDMQKLAKQLQRNINSTQEMLERKIDSVNQTSEWSRLTGGFSKSATFRDKPSLSIELMRWLPVARYWKLCYRASRDGWKSTDFHSRCDYKGPTVTIIRVGSYIFGGYTDKSWGGSSRYISSSNSFIFSFQNKYNTKPFKSTIYRYSQYAIYTSSGYGPIFGGGHDIYVVNNAHASTSSYSDLGYTYRPPSGYSYGNSNTKAFLAGSYKFKPSEVEVFY